MTRQEAGKKGNAVLVENYKKRYYASPNFCSYCDNELTYKQRHNKFCSHSCAASSNNPGRRKVEKFCANCGASIRSDRKYCNRRCQSEYQKKRKYENWVNAGESPNVATMKRIIIEKRGHVCEQCGTESWNGLAVPLDMHHIDADATNNDINNLQLLCPNCHAQTESYCSRNYGNGRNYRRLYDRAMRERIKGIEAS